MGRNKTETWAHDRFARMVATRRGIEMLHEDAFREQATLRALVVENSGFPLLDDVLEEIERPGQPLALHAWQIKQQTTPFPYDELKKILIALRDPPIAKGIIGFTVPVDIVDGSKVIGELRILQEPCDRTREPGCDQGLFINGLRKNETPFWDLLKNISNQSETDAFALAKRTEVRFLRDETRMAEGRPT